MSLKLPYNFKRLIAYTVSAGAAGLADIGLFSLLTAKVFPAEPLFTTLAAVIARVVSSVINFLINCRYVFHGQKRTAVLRYYTLWAVQLAASCLLVNLIGHGLKTNLTVAKACGDLALGFVSYQIQGRWVFKPVKGFYGPIARIARNILRIFSKMYDTDLRKTEEPKVYVCRHLNMHGPYTTIKWLPFHVHPMVLHVFFDRKLAAEQYNKYTFTVRRGKDAKAFSIAALIMSNITVPVIQSLQAIPTHRDSASMSTLKHGLRYLLKGEDVIVFPDVNYTGGYGSDTQLYSGFFLLGDLYYRKTGKKLEFVPLVLDDEHRRIEARPPIAVSNFRNEGEFATAYMKAAINKEELDSFKGCKASTQ